MICIDKLMIKKQTQLHHANKKYAIEKGFVSVVVLLALSFVAGKASAEFMTTDFSDYNLGNLNGQQGWVVNNPAGTTTVIESLPLLPSPSSLQYVQMDGGTSSGGGNIMTSTYVFDSTPTIGPISYEFVWAYTNARASTDNMFRAYLSSSSNSSIGAMLFFRDLGNGTANVIYPPSDNSSNFHNGQVVANISPDQFYRFRIDFAGENVTGDMADAVTVSIYDMSDTLIGQVTGETYYQDGVSSPGANMIQFYDYGWGDQVFYIDSVSIVPEPSSLALLALGSLCFLRRRRSA